MARPLVHVRAAAYRLGHGDRSVRVEPEGPREVAEVADALNALTAALATSEARQRDFLLSVSHELRTPLTAVRGYAEALADGVVEGDEVRPTGVIVRAEAERLNRLVTDLLDLARVGAQDLRLDLHQVDLVPLVTDAVAVWSARGVAEEVEVVAEVPSGELWTRTDATRLRQIIDNLAENALRVTPSGARMVLAARAGDEGSVVVEVRDSGPGLTDDDILVAFEPSALYERYRGVRKSGSGVGLALAARLGGRAEADRAGDGGAVLRVVLPKNGPPGADRPYDSAGTGRQDAGPMPTDERAES
jgi:two-component system, OmpR family, sensor kinase